MIEKVNLRQVLGIAIVGVAVCFLFRSCGRANTINQLQADTNETMGTVKAESAILAVEVERSIATSGSLGEAINETGRAVTGSREAAATLKAGIGELKHTLAECQRLADENAKLIAEIDKGH